MTTRQIVAAGCLAAAAQLLCPPVAADGVSLGYYPVWEAFNPACLDWVRLALQIGATVAVTAGAAAVVRPAPASASPPAAASPR